MYLMTVLVVSATAVSVAGVDVWWESAVVYQIYPRSFKDSDGDGIGDLNGIREEVSHLAETGVDAIWMSPIFESPMLDFGYDITNYTSIAVEYGTMADFDNLVAEAKRVGIRIVLDYVPNHTSDLSEWFIKSVQKIGNYTDYYVWANAKTDPNNASIRLPPSNWVSNFRKSAWEFNEVRQQYYLHQFIIGQPDLNFRYEPLREEMKNVLRFWMDRGVAGFRVDSVNQLYEVDATNGVYPDEPRSNVSGATPDDYDYLLHIYTRDQDETYDVVYDWRDVLNEYTEKHNESKILMTEAYTDIGYVMRYYGSGDRNGSIPFNFLYLKGLTKTSTAKDIKTLVDNWMTNMPAGKVPNWVNGNHDQSRLASRHGVKRVDAMNMLALLLPGITITYQGEELGMTDGFMSWAETQDPQSCNTDDPINYWTDSRDLSRTPYHWDPSTYAGFTNGSSTWLPLPSNYPFVNLYLQMAATKSHYKFYKDVVALKRTPAVKSGNLTTHAISDTLLVVTRVLANNPAVIGIINLADSATQVDLSSLSEVPETLSVVASGISCSVEKGVQVKKNAINVTENCALALQSVQTSDANRFLASFTVYCIVYFIYGNLVM